MSKGYEKKLAASLQPLKHKRKSVGLIYILWLGYNWPDERISYASLGLWIKTWSPMNNKCPQTPAIPQL